MHKSAFKTTDGFGLSAASQGAGHPVVLLHGFPMDHTVWNRQVETLAARYRVIAPDLCALQNGFTRPNKVTVEQWADGLAALLDGLKIDEPIVLGGLSMGGYIAMQFFRAHRSRLAALMLCDTRAAADAPQAGAGRFETAARLEREGAAFLPDAMLPRLLAPATFDNRPAAVDFMRRMILSGDARCYAAISRGLAERPDFTPLMPRIDCPTLLIVGRQDAISPVAEMAAMVRSIPASRLVEIEAAGHVAPLEAPQAVTQAMEEFLAGVYAPR